MYHIKYSRWRVNARVRKMAKRLKQDKRMDDNTVFLVMLSGGVWFAQRLFDAWGDIPNEVYYIKGHSYSHHTRGEFIWDLLPSVDLTNRDVIILDDICDSGETLKAVYEHFKGRVKSIMAVTLLKRMPCPIQIDMPMFSCIEDATSDFFVGCGLDDDNKGRLLRYIAIC